MSNSDERLQKLDEAKLRRLKQQDWVVLSAGVSAAAIQVRPVGTLRPAPRGERQTRPSVTIWIGGCHG